MTLNEYEKLKQGDILEREDSEPVELITPGAGDGWWVYHLEYDPETESYRQVGTMALLTMRELMKREVRN